MRNEMHQSNQIVGPQPAATRPHHVSLASSALTDEQHLIKQLRRGSEAAFVSLLDRYAPKMLCLAMAYVKTWAVAEEVVQETWLAVLEGLNRFEGRSSLKTWLFRILTNCAITRAQHEGRYVPLSSLPEHNPDLAEPALASDRFFPPDQRCTGQWTSFPANQVERPEAHLLSQETLACIRQAIATLPGSQQQIIILRDIDGWTSEETCQHLGISEVNQRVLLHRARSKVRRELERYLQAR